MPPGDQAEFALCCEEVGCKLISGLVCGFVRLPRLAHWPRCISAGKRLISYGGLFMSGDPFRFSSPRSDLCHITSLFAASSPSMAFHIPFFRLVNKLAHSRHAACGLTLLKPRWNSCSLAVTAQIALAILAACATITTLAGRRLLICSSHGPGSLACVSTLLAP